MTLGGEQLSFKSPREALAHGIVTIVQELAIVPGLTSLRTSISVSRQRRGIRAAP